MLVAHIVPGYFAAVKSQPRWKPEWNAGQRTLLWAAALGSTILPDLDVIYNTALRGFINHSTLWTHSLFVHLSVALSWWLLRSFRRWPYLQTLVGLVAVGSISHLALDVIAHSTPLLYPVSLVMFGFPPERVVKGGFWAYVTDPIFLFEPFLLALAVAHWTLARKPTRQVRTLMLIMLTGGLVLFTVTFLLWLPILQGAAAVYY